MKSYIANVWVAKGQLCGVWTSQGPARKILNCGAGEDSWESLGLQRDPPVHPKGNQHWISIGRTDAEAEAAVLWPPHAKSRLIGKDPDAVKDWGQEKGMTEDEMVGPHHQLNGHEFGWTPGDGDGQESLACFSPWAAKSQIRLNNWRTTAKKYLPSNTWIDTQIPGCCGIAKVARRLAVSGWM